MSNGYDFSVNYIIFKHNYDNNNAQCLTYDHPNGFTYLQLGRDFINLFYLNIWHLKTIHRTTFLSFWIVDFINKIENFPFIHIQGR